MAFGYPDKTFKPYRNINHNETMAMIANITKDEIDWLVPHQANIRIVDSVGERLNLEKDKVMVALDHHGNTSAASIPLAMSEYLQAGKLQKGQLLVLTAMGAGFTWGGTVIRF